MRAALLLAGAGVIALVLAACGGGGEERGPVHTPIGSRYLPQTVSSELVVGTNRFMVGLMDQEENRPVLGAQLHFRFFKLEGTERVLKDEMDATPIRITRTYTHIHEDGTVETHEAGDIGVYVATVEFDSPGDWAVEVSGSIDGQEMEPVAPTFTVLEEGFSPAVGEPAPRTAQPTLSDVADITELCTDDAPNPEMHDMTIAQAVTSGRPTVIVFATPAFCVSQICGPTKEAVDDLFVDYKDRVNFVHVEPYDLEKARSGEALEPLPFLWDEWGLRSEPWVFLVDSEGNVAAKFEAIVTREELEEALVPLLSPSPTGGDTRY